MKKTKEKVLVEGGLVIRLKMNYPCYHPSIKSLTSFLIVIFLSLGPGVLASWDDWWTYDGISGPAFWGLINPQWSLCSKGRRQSPINVEPSKLLYDPSLRPIHIDKTPISGVLRNTGQTVVFTIEKGSPRVNMTGGPLAYRYQFEELYVHYGPEDVLGSEHLIQGIAFPAELQLYGFNVELYSNLSDAQQKPNGVVGISIMIRVSDDVMKSPNSELPILTSVLGQIKFRNQSAVIKAISLHGLLPETDYYMTYEGSTTHPGCWETVTWVILNKPVYLSRQMVTAHFIFHSVHPTNCPVDLGSSSIETREQTRVPKNSSNERETNTTNASQDSENKYKFPTGSGQKMSDNALFNLL